MGEHLRHASNTCHENCFGPKLRERGLASRIRCESKRNFQPQVEAAMLLIVVAEKIRQGRRIAFWTLECAGAKWGERLHGYNPGRK